MGAADEASGFLAGAFGVAAKASGASPIPVPVVGAWGTTEVRNVVLLVPVRVSGLLIPEKNDVIVVRGVAAAGTVGVGGADAFGPLWRDAAVAS